MTKRDAEAAPTAHIIGAGLAGLSAAVRLAGQGGRVRLYEATGHAGGRCRSFYDETLGCRIDNGNHLLLSGNHATRAYLTSIGAQASLVGPDETGFPFIDLRTGERWIVKPDRGRIPWSLLSRKNRVPGSSLWEYLKAFRLAWAGPDATIEQCLQGNGTLFERFWEPLAVSVLNTEAAQASARLLWPVLLETFGRGAAACQPLIVREGLSESFVNPALHYLEKTGNAVHFNHLLRRLSIADNRVNGLQFGDVAIPVGEADRVVLAVPPAMARKVISQLTVPDDHRPIVNGHFRLPVRSAALRVVGMVGGDAHWLFVRDDIASVTVSAATELSGLGAEAIAPRLWADICQSLKLGDLPLPAYRIVKEKRATFAQTPRQLEMRPEAVTDLKNLFLAGDWTQNGLPATIEGTIRTGYKAADLVRG